MNEQKFGRKRSGAENEEEQIDGEDFDWVFRAHFLDLIVILIK